MSPAESTVVPDEGLVETSDRVEDEKAEEAKPKRQPPYAVILHNDDLNGMDFVVTSIRKVFNYGRLRALKLMLKAHISGQSVLWSGALEVAELKADQLRSCGADPTMRAYGATTLTVTIEPLPQ